MLPHAGNLFRDKLPGAVFVGSAFSKLAGSTQVKELGEIETPIARTSTLEVPRVADAVLNYLLMLPANEQVRSVDPLVGETNDEYVTTFADGMLGAPKCSSRSARRTAARWKREQAGGDGGHRIQRYRIAEGGRVYRGRPGADEFRRNIADAGCTGGAGTGVVGPGVGRRLDPDRGRDRRAGGRAKSALHRDRDRAR